MRNVLAVLGWYRMAKCCVRNVVPYGEMLCW